MTTLVEELGVRTRDLERFNYAPATRTFDCKMIEAGVVNYPDKRTGGLELLRKETIEACMPTAIGIPVTILHVDYAPLPVPPEETHGVVTEWYFCPEDGWYHVKGILDSKEAETHIKLGWKPSCGYILTAIENNSVGKTHHGIRYSKEITGLRFHHLAIEPKVRYEDADFRLNKQPVSNPTMNPIKAIWKAVVRLNGADSVPQETTQELVLPSDTVVELDGKQVRLNKAFDAPAEVRVEVPVPAQLTPETTYEVDGVQVKLADLAESHRLNAAAKKNAGLGSFAALQGARAAGAAAEPAASSFDSPSERLKRGNVRY